LSTAIDEGCIGAGVPLITNTGVVISVSAFRFAFGGVGGFGCGVAVGVVELGWWGGWFAGGG